MKRSRFLNMRLPERGAREGEANDSADIEDLTYDIEIIDTTLEKHDTENKRLEREKVSQSDLNNHIIENNSAHKAINKNLSDHKVEVDNKFSMLESNIDWKEAVNTFDDIATTYPTPQAQDGWTVNVKDTDYTYRYNGSAWIAISANAIPKATRVLDGLMSKEKIIEVEANTASKHMHKNKTLLDGITETLINSWNTVSKKLNLAGGVLTGFLTLHAKPINDMHAVNKKYVDDIISAVGGGDMSKAVFDTNNSGVVDNAEKLGGKEPSYYEPAFEKNMAFNKDFGSAAKTVCEGNDYRLSDARAANGGTSDDSLKLNGQAASYYGKAPKSYTATIGTSWQGTAAPYTQTIPISGVLATDTPIVDVVLSATAATALSQIEAWGHVGKITTAANSITITCYEEKPTIAIPIQLKVVR